MTTRRPSMLQLALLAIPLLVAALAAARAAGTTTAGELPVGSLIAILAVLYVLVVAAGMFGAFERPVLMARVAEGARAIVEAARSVGIPLTDRLVRPRRPGSVRIVAASGDCPLGLLTGRKWQMDASGRLDLPICRPAAAAVERLASGADAPVTAACVCPRGRQSLTFALNAA